MRISDKVLQEKLGWTPTPPQQEILQKSLDKRDVTICAGTRFGKSMLCGYVAFRQLLYSNQRIWIVSLTYDMAKKIFDYVVDFAAKYDRRLLKGLENRPTPSLRVPEWNSWIECKSADNETSLMGEELNLAILDEAARMKPDIWERFVTARLTSRKGKSFVISTPFGQNWFYKRYLQTQEAPDGLSFHFTSKDNPYFPPEEWERARTKLPSDIFQQEYEAAFLADAASVFRNIRGCIRDTKAEPKTGHRYVMGLDLAQFQDFTVMLIIDKTNHEMVFFDRFTKIPYPVQKGRIIDVARKYATEIVIDATNVGASIGDDLRSEGLTVVDFKAVGSTNADKSQKGNKEQAIIKLNSFFEENNITILPEPVLVGELETYGYKLTPAGNIVYGAPEGLHDDCVSALYLAVWQLYGKKTRENIKAYQAIPPKKKTFQYF